MFLANDIIELVWSKGDDPTPIHYLVNGHKMSFSEYNDYREHRREYEDIYNLRIIILIEMDRIIKKYCTC